MKALLFKSIFLTTMVGYTVGLNAQFDDLYYDYRKDEIVTTPTSRTYTDNTQERYSDDEQYASDSNDGNYYDNDEYENYDEYSYATQKGL